MNETIDSLFLRSCLESSPARFPSKAFGLSAEARPVDRHMQLHQLKQNMLRAFLEGTRDARLWKCLCGLANQAAELAWTTPEPTLAFHWLFERMAREACHEPPLDSDLNEGSRYNGIEGMAEILDHNRESSAS